MRVIAGDSRGGRLRAPRGLTTRPATARVRASIFSRLASCDAISDGQVLDLFAGSGSLGLEALSRGAASAVFVDASRDAVATIQHNLRHFGLESRGRVISADWARALPQLAAESARFDLVFVDPPFASDCCAQVLAKLVALELLKPDGIITVRQYYRAPELVVADWELMSSARLGDHRIALYRPAQAAMPANGPGSNG